MRRLPLLLVLIALLAAGGAWGQTAPDPRIVYKRGTVVLSQGARQVRLRVEVADTPAARHQGLMYRRHLPEDAGMLFIFEATGRGGFWMKNTWIPLSIAFIDEGWTIVDIKDMAVAPNPEQGPFTIYVSAEPYRYALEVNQGFFERHRITVGGRVRYIPQPP
ncbi:MAG TPA: DUF192 domain-containing protein [bacterium]|nr:DUF192 domain-containing protein [bacterium]